MPSRRVEDTIVADRAGHPLHCYMFHGGGQCGMKALYVLKRLLEGLTLDVICPSIVGLCPTPEAERWMNTLRQEIADSGR